MGSRGPALRGLAMGLTAQGRTQPLLADPPEIVLDTVDERYRDLVPVFTQVILGVSDVTFVPGHAEIRGDPGDDHAGVVAQMTARPAEQGDPVPGGWQRFGGRDRGHRRLRLPAGGR